MVVDFQIVCLDESEHTATNLMKVGQGGDAPGLDFIGGFPVQGGRQSEVGEISGSGIEFSPEGCRGIA